MSVFYSKAGVLAKTLWKCSSRHLCKMQEHKQGIELFDGKSQRNVVPLYAKIVGYAQNQLSKRLNKLLSKCNWKILSQIQQLSTASCLPVPKWGLWNRIWASIKRKGGRIFVKFYSCNYRDRHLCNMWKHRVGT